MIRSPTSLALAAAAIADHPVDRQERFPMKRSFGLICVVLLFIAQTPPSPAQSEFKKALQSKYDLKTVSCFACHIRKADIPEDQQAAFKKNAKSFRNDFGKEFDRLLDGKNITKRLAAVKELEADDPQKKKVKEEVTKEFLVALKEVEQVKSPSGVTYGELLEKGKLDGVKPK
jgi:hypothetical protein